MKCIMKALALASIGLLRGCGFVVAHRVHTGEETAIYRILGHPAVGPLSSLARQLELLEAATPCLLNAAGDDKDVLHSVQALRKRSILLHPIIRHIVFIISKPSASGEDEEERAGLLRESTEGVLDSVSQLSERVAQMVPLTSETCPGLPGLNVVEAMAAAKRHAAERFIIHEFIPHSEKLYAISEGLKALSTPEALPSATKAFESLAETWRNVHDSAVAAGRALLQKVMTARRAVSWNQTNDETRRLAALSQYTLKNVAEKLQLPASVIEQNVDADHVLRRLDLLHEALSRYERHRSPTRLSHSEPHKSTSLSEAMQLAFEVETVLPHFQYLHSDLQSTKHKLRLLTSRFQDTTENASGGIKTNNKIRNKINNLHADVDRLLRLVRTQASAALGLHKGKLTSERLELMEPLLRLQQLIHLTQTEGRYERFQTELEGLRNLLRKLHREAERLHVDSATVRTLSPALML